MIFLFPLPVPCLRECEINYLLHIRRIFDAYARLCEIVPYNPYSGHSLSRAHCIAIQHIQQVWPYNIQLIHHTAHVAAPLAWPCPGALGAPPRQRGRRVRQRRTPPAPTRAHMHTCPPYPEEANGLSSSTLTAATTKPMNNTE